MEISSTAGKSWQPSHEPPHRKGKQAPVTVNKQWKEGEKDWGKLPGWRAPTPHNTASSCSKHMQECTKRRANCIWLHKIDLAFKHLNTLFLHLLVPCRVSSAGQTPEGQDTKGTMAAPCWTEASWSRNVNKNDWLILRHLRFIVIFWSCPLLVLIFNKSFTSEQVSSSKLYCFPFLYSRMTLIGRTCPGAIAKALSSAVSLTENWGFEEDSFTVETLVTFSQLELCKLLMGIEINVEKSFPSTRSGKNEGDKTWNVCFVSKSLIVYVNAMDPLVLRRSFMVCIPRDSLIDDLQKDGRVSDLSHINSKLNPLLRLTLS